MEMVQVASELTLGFFGLGLTALIASAIVTALVAFAVTPIPWKAKVVILLVVANEIRGVAIAAPIAWSLFS
jgi:hypothetical protein